MISGGNDGTFHTCEKCGTEYRWPGPHECGKALRADVATDAGYEREDWCPKCGKYHVEDERHRDDPYVPAAPFAEAISVLVDGPPNKERALAAICRILDRLEKDDQHRVVDALVALGAG